MATPATTSEFYEAIDTALKGKGEPGLTEFVAARRADRLSWAKIALRIFELTGKPISYETLRLRFGPDTAA